MQYKFVLVFELPGKRDDPRIHTDRLREAGCGDADFCWGIRGHAGLEFHRDANSLSDAKKHAIKQVQAAIPGATLVFYEH